MRKIIYVNKTTNALIKEYGFTNYIMKRDAFLQTQQDIDIKINCSVRHTLKNFYRCLIKEMTVSIWASKRD